MLRLLLIILLSTPSFAQSDFIKSENLMKTVEYLASEELEGRLGGSEGYYKAAVFMANEFSKIGLQPFQGKSYFQKFNVEYNEILPPCSLNLIDDDKIVKEYKLGNDYVFRGFTGSGDIKGEVVFAGYGISSEETGYDDYNGIDVTDKIVMVFKENPRWKIEDKNWPEGTPRPKSKVAADKGAKAILFVSFPNDENPRAPIGSVLHGSGEQNVSFPQLHIDLHVADDFFKNSGYTLSELQTKIENEKKPFSVELNSELQIVVNAKYEKEKETVNVIGILPGSDEKLKDEYVILGAHLDHVGQQGKEIYFPGANDNASGSAAVLEIARAFAVQEVSPKRSIIFALFSNEESGLEGAQFLADNLPVDKERVVAMLNMDCVGHGDSIQLGNGKSAPNLWDLARELDKQNAKLTVDATWSGGGADATPFHKIGIPTLYIVTRFSYTHLHSQSDKPETLNPVVFEEITKLACKTLSEIADGKYRREAIVN
ncbi:MAG: M20/M25/M40 family metallo-hydrolase [Melioribacteraceae bacterium]|nr:M20/M25/M40 family metallo-hydrolase [Melioribacteraceae bacterium]